VFDKNTNQPLAGATIRLEGTSYGAISNKNGFFRLAKIPKGEFSIIVTSVGYNSFRGKINIPQDDTLRVFLVEKTLRTSEIVVSATKRLQVVQEVPISVSIVSDEVFQKRNYLRFDEALRNVSGVIINKDNINIRGSSGFSLGLGSRVAYLVDGIPFLAGENADAKFDIIPVEMISRVEIVKGSGSALYGSSAIGGVVNIITKEPSETAAYNIGFQGGFYTKPKYEQWVYTNKLTTKSSIGGYYSSNLGFVKLALGGYILNDESYRKYDKSFRGNIFGKVSKDIKDYGKLTVFGFFASDRRDDWVYWNSLDSATIPPTNTDLTRKLLSNKGNISADLRLILTGRTFVDLRSSLYNTDLSMNISPIDPEYRQSSAFSWNNELQLNSHFANNILLTSGLNYTRNWVNSNIYGVHKQNWFSSYTQVELSNFDRFILTFGGRLDIEKTDSTDMNFEISPKLGLNYSLTQNNSLRLSVGRGFRSPSLAERFSSIKYSGFEVVPNLKLRSEKSWSAEFGSLFEFQDWFFPTRIDFALFYTRFYDLVEPQFDLTMPKPVIKFQNITNAEILGTELSLQTLLFRLLPVTFGLTFLEPKDIDSAMVLKYRPRWNLVASITFPYDNFSVVTDFRYISKIERIDETLRLQVPDYDARVPIYVLDFSLQVDFRKYKLPFRLNFSVQNVLDYYYVEMVGNLAPTRLISMKIQYLNF
jgi:iron complex outermembrane receptor protein